MNRRSLLKAIPFLGAAAALPAVSVVATPAPAIEPLEWPADRWDMWDDTTVPFSGPSQYLIEVDGRHVLAFVTQDGEWCEGCPFYMAWWIDNGKRTGLGKCFVAYKIKFRRKIASDMKPWRIVTLRGLENG